MSQTSPKKRKTGWKEGVQALYRVYLVQFPYFFGWKVIFHYWAEPVPYLELFWVKPVKKSPCITRYFLQNTSSSPGNLQVHTWGDDSKTYFHAVPQTRQTRRTNKINSNIANSTSNQLSKFIKKKDILEAIISTLRISYYIQTRLTLKSTMNLSVPYPQALKIGTQTMKPSLQCSHNQFHLEGFKGRSTCKIKCNLIRGFRGRLK